MTKYPELTERFLKYVKVDTQSDENSEKIGRAHV